MKKLLFAAIAMILLSTSASALYLEGKVNDIRINASGTYARLLVGTSTISGWKKISSSLSADLQKSILATLMMAKSTGGTIVFIGAAADVEDVVLR